MMKLASDKRYIFDLWGDTRENLDALSEVSKISTAELVRRGAECALILYGIEPTELKSSLLDNLSKIRYELARNSSVRADLVPSLSKTVAFAASLSAIYMINEGRESHAALQLYAQSMREHLATFNIQKDSDFKPRERDTLKSDVESFLNLLNKMDKFDKEKR